MQWAYVSTCGSPSVPSWIVLKAWSAFNDLAVQLTFVFGQGGSGSNMSDSDNGASCIIIGRHTMHGPLRGFLSVGAKSVG